MFKRNIILIINLIFILNFSNQVNGDRTKDRMYEEIVGASACFRKLNGTHQIGCSSKIGGSTGVIHFCETEDDLKNIMSEGNSDTYIPILPIYLFNPAIIDLLTNSKISGLILYSLNDSIKSINNFTHEHQCPNPYSSLADTCKKESTWNPWGTGLLYKDIPFPIFYVDNTQEVVLIKECFKKFNNYSYEEQASRPLCSLELNSFMYATTSTPTCIRRSNIVSNLNPQKFCDPLGNNNVWASLFPLVEGPRRNETKPITDQSYIVVAARLDTTSMFEKTSGASSPVTGIVTLLSLAKYLNSTIQLEDIKLAKKNILFFLFSGETYDYIGSQRMLYDMLHGNFPIHQANKSHILPPISVENIDLFIEISSLGNADNKVYVHDLNEISEVVSFISILQNHNSTYLAFERVSGSLPPSSLHTFLKNTSSFPGLLIADHKNIYSNHFYNSIYDNSTNIGFQYYPNLTQKDVGIIPKDTIQYLIANVTEIVGKSIYQVITNTEYKGDIRPDVILVNELFYCYLEDPNCKVHKAIQKGLKIPKIPLSLYVGVTVTDHFATSLAGLTLGWFTGKEVGPANINCTNIPRNYAFKYYNISRSIYDLNTTVCYQVTMNTTEAVSPAFLIPDYDWTSGQYSTWSESTWKEINVRMFLKPSANQERLTVTLGCITMLFSFVVVYFIKSKSHILFTVSVPSEAPTNC